MRQTRGMEIAVGVFVVAGVAALFMLAFKVSNLSGFSARDTYRLTARFDNVGSLKVRGAVTMAGVQIGRVADIRFDDETYEAVVELAIAERYHRLPADTSASILTAGLLGEQYIGLEPGGAPRYLEPGDEIKLTQSALVLEQIIGQALLDKAQ